MKIMAQHDAEWQTVKAFVGPDGAVHIVFVYYIKSNNPSNIYEFKETRNKSIKYHILEMSS